MKKIIRLTETDLARIVKRVIKENEKMGKNSHSIYSDALDTLIKNGDILKLKDGTQVRVGAIPAKENPKYKTGMVLASDLSRDARGPMTIDINNDVEKVMGHSEEENEENRFDFYMEELSEFANKLDWEDLDIEGEEMEYFVDEIYQIVHNAKQDDNLSKDEISKIEGFAMGIVSRLD